MSYIKHIELVDVSKRYTREWILKNVTHTFSRDRIYSIQGANGSGKSTLLKMLSGYLSPSVGKIRYVSDTSKTVDRDDIYQHCAIWGPYVELIGKLTIKEMVDYYYAFKSLRNGVDKESFFNMLDLPLSKHAMIDSLSSGQAQRLGLALAILSDADILLLDEPGSFLDATSMSWYHELLAKYSEERIIIIASNDVNDFSARAVEVIQVGDYK